MTTNEMIQKRSEVAMGLRTLMQTAEKEKRFLTAEEKTKYDRMVSDLNEISDMQTRSEQLAKITNEMESIDEPDIRFDKPHTETRDEQRDLFRSFLTGKLPQYQEGRTMTTASGADGGFAVPEKYSSTLFETALANSCVRRLSTVELWDSDGAFPIVSDKGSAYLIGENSGTDVTAAATVLEQKKIVGYQMMWMKVVSKILAAKASYNLEAKLPRWWGEKLAEKEEYYFINGNGTTQPGGLIAGATAGTATAANSAITGDDVINWAHKLARKYRVNATWIFADNTVKLLRQTKNPVTTSGALNYIWMPGLGKEPDMLYGAPVEVSDYMPAFAAGANVGVFGNIKEFVIADFKRPEMLYDPYTAGGQGMVRYIGWTMVDSVLPLSEAVVTCPIHA